MPRRAMLPYPSTSRRLCATARCPRITTVALVSILLACLYNSRTFLSKEQPTLNRVVDSGAPRTVLEPAVEVVKEVIDNSDGVQTVYNNVADLTTENPPLSVDERPADGNAVSVTDLETSTGQKDLVGFIADAQKDQPERASVDATDETASEAVAPDVAERTDGTSVTPAETISTAEKAEEETASDAATPNTAIDSAGRTDDADSATTTNVVGGEVPALEKQEDVDETSTTTETVSSQSDVARVDADAVTVEKQESEDEADNAGEDVNGVDSEVLIADKQDSVDGSAEVEAAVNGEEASPLVKTAEKDASETSEKEEVETVDKQETKEAAAVAESERSDEQDPLADGLDAADKQDAVDSGETDSTETISNSEKQEENTEETANNTEIAAAEKQKEVESDADHLEESEKEKVEADFTNQEAVDGATDTDLSSADKMKDEDSIGKEREEIKGVDDIDAADKQDQESETEAVIRKDENSSETEIDGELDTAEKQEGDEATSIQESQGDDKISHGEKQDVEVRADENKPEKGDDGITEAPKDRRR